LARRLGIATLDGLDFDAQRLNMDAVLPTRDRYDAVTIAFHWLTALLVLALFATGALREYAPRAWHLFWLEGIHVSLGIGLAAVLIGRLGWRLIAGRRLASIGTRLTSMLARLVHALLYVLLAMQVALGFSLRWLQGEDFTFFGLFSIPSLLTTNRSLAHMLEDIHNYAAWAVVIIAGGHAAAALVHRYVLKDGVLRRMLPIAG
jgi:cytochrome b561